MSLGFPVKVDWDGPDDSAEVVYDPPPEVVILSAEVCREYYEEKDIYDKDQSIWLKFSLTVSTILLLMYFIFPSELIDSVSKINII